MRVVVCCKQIPDPATPYQLDPADHTLIRPEDQILDDTDRYAIEVGLQLARAASGTVTAVSMGPQGTMQGIRQALAMGVDGATVVDDPALHGADALLTAKVLAAAGQRAGFDLIVSGTESTDGYSGVLPQMMAEALGIPSLTYATRVEAGEGRVVIHRQTAAGYDLVDAALPALVSVTAGAVEPRYPTFKGIMDAKKKPVETIGLAELGIAAATTQQVTDVTEATARTGGSVIEDDGQAHIRIIELLKAKKVL